MKIETYYINAFTNQLYAGNPAAVCILEHTLPDRELQQIATEINLPATAFLRREQDQYTIRWFGPEYEIDLCGHGTLASGYVTFNFLEPKSRQINFLHPLLGPIKVARKESSIILDFPAKHTESWPAPDILAQGLGRKPKEIYQHKKERILAIYDKEEEVRAITPDIELLRQLEHRGIIISAPGNDVDFVSRVFYPKKTLFEDQVTGSSHCLLVPYWSQRLNKKTHCTLQLSKRGGALFCELHEDRISLQGEAVLFMQGVIQI